MSRDCRSGHDIIWRGTITLESGEKVVTYYCRKCFKKFADYTSLVELAKKMKKVKL